MNARPLDLPPTSQVATLVIHAGRKTACGDQRMASTVNMLRSLMTRVGSAGAAEHLQLQITDLDGQPLRTIDDAGPLTVVTLPAATYHVTAIMPRRRRRYTLTLTPDASFELDLRLGGEPDPRVTDVQ